jgi:hypothetical protein
MKRLALLAMPIIAACASNLDWEKPGASRAAVDADVRACRLAAQNVPTLPRPQTAQPSGTATTTTGTDLDADRQLAEAQRVDACMRQRGYQLVQRPR